MNDLLVGIDTHVASACQQRALLPPRRDTLFVVSGKDSADINAFFLRQLYCIGVTYRSLRKGFIPGDVNQSKIILAVAPLQVFYRGINCVTTVLASAVGLQREQRFRDFIQVGCQAGDLPDMTRAGGNTVVAVFIDRPL